MLSKIGNVSFKVTNACNMGCKYCFQPKEIKESDGGFRDYNALYNFLKKCNLDEKLNITMTGGEPSLFPERIIKIHRIFKRLERQSNTKVSLSITTNGTDLNTIENLMNIGVFDTDHVLISYDGLYSSKSRPSIYTDDHFNHNIERIGNQSSILNNITVSTAITPINIDFMKETIKFIYRSGVIKWKYYFITDFEEEYQSDGFIQKFSDFLQFAIENKPENFHLTNLEYYHYKKMMLDFIGDEYYSRMGYCNKITNSLYIHTNGDIYPCMYFSDHCRYSDKDNPLLLGSIYKGIHKEKCLRFYQDIFGKIDKLSKSSMQFPAFGTTICCAIKYFSDQNYAISPFWRLQLVEDSIYKKYNFIPSKKLYMRMEQHDQSSRSFRYDSEINEDIPIFI